MRSSFTIFLLGLVLGSTLGIGGIWTQVVQPAGQKIRQLESEHGIMQTALDEAGKALKEVAVSLREGESRPAPMSTGEIFPRNGGSSISPSGITPERTDSAERTLEPVERTRIADRLEKLALKLDDAKVGKITQP